MQFYSEVNPIMSNPTRSLVSMCRIETCSQPVLVSKQKIICFKLDMKNTVALKIYNTVGSQVPA